MRKFFVYLFMAAVLSFGLAACASSPKHASTGQFLDDRVITTKVKTKLLENDNTSGLNIDVDTFKGTVELNGFVGSEKEKQTATQVAKGVAGVQKVINNLVVKGQQDQQSQSQ